MIVIGLTGSIGMGKSTTARLFAEEGAPVFDADACVHALYARGGAAVGPIAALRPDVVVDGTVDRARLRAAVTEDPPVITVLERIVHPLVAAARAEFLDHHRSRGAGVVVIDVPLLFETGAEDSVERVVTVSAPAEVQRERVLARPGMTLQAFENLLAKQTPDAVKRAKSDYVVDSGQGIDHARSQVRAILKDLMSTRT